MSNYKLQTVIDGKIIKESTLKLSANDKLIVQPNQKMSYEAVVNLHKSIEDALSSDSKVLVIPSWA